MWISSALSRCVPFLGLTALLLGAGCAQKEQPQPTPEPEAPLAGRWQQGVSHYAYTNSRGQRTPDAGTSPAPNPATFATFDATTWKYSGQLTNEYFYTRTDSVLNRFYFINNQQINERYSIVELTPHRLVLRSTLGPTQEGGFWQFKQEFTR